jgi:hypothetical protein
MEEIKRLRLNKTCKEYSEECSSVPGKGHRLTLKSLEGQFPAVMNEGRGKNQIL